MKQNTKKMMAIIVILVISFLSLGVGQSYAANETKNTTTQTNTTKKSTKTTNTTTSDKTKETNTKSSSATYTKASGEMYVNSSVNFRSSDNTSSESYGKIEKGEAVTLLEKGSNGWYKVSYNGKTGYIKSSYLSKEEINKEEQAEEEKSENDTKFGLDTLKVENVTLTPEFKKDVYEYKAELNKNVERIKVEATTDTEGAKVDISGNDSLVEGENLITIIVTGKGADGKEQTATYQVVVNRVSVEEQANTEQLEKDQKALNTKLWIVRIVIAIIVIAIIVFLIIRYRRQDHSKGREFSVPFESLVPDKKEEKESYKEEFLNQFDEKPKAFQEEEQKEEEPVEETQQTREIEIPKEGVVDLEEQEEERVKRNRKGKGKHF